MLIAHLWKIAPPPIFSSEPYPPLASQNSATVLKELKCMVCSNILKQPLELPCRQLACTSCAVERVAASTPVCPCCSEDSSLVPTEIRPAPNAVLLLLKDVLVQCVGCHRDMKAGCYDGHECTPYLTAGEEREAAALLKRAISTSPDQAGIIQLPTGGTPMTFMHVTKARHLTSAACSKTVKTRRAEMQTARSIVSGGEPSALMEEEVLTLSDEERMSLLQKAGITNIAIDSVQVLAIKVGMAIPWNGLRQLRRWLKASGVSLAGEQRMRNICRQIVGDNLKGEMALFSFPHPSGGEELRGAPLVYIPDLVQKVVDLLEENERTGRLTWHNGVIPASEVWLKIGGDKGGGSFKMNFQIVNVPAPNSVHNTCVFCCFEAGDTVTNLHIALDRYKDQVAHLQGMKWRQYTLRLFMCGDYEFITRMYGLSGASGCYPCLYCLAHHQNLVTPLSVRGPAPPRTFETISADHQHYIASGVGKKQAQHFYNCISEPIFNIPISQVCPPGLHITLGIFTKIYGLLEDECHTLDLELALHSREDAHSSFSKYSHELQRLRMLQAELEQAQKSYDLSQQIATYVSLVVGENDPVTVDFFKQCEDKMKSLKQLETDVANCTATVKKGFSIKDGPFVKELDSALQSIGVHRQQYFGGAFVGNHVHKTLKLSNIQTLCKSLVQTAQKRLPHCVAELQQRTDILVNTFCMFASCHNIYDQNFIDEAQTFALEHAIEQFMAYFRKSFPEATVPIKMHILEDHATTWANSTHVGFGLLGEQGAESIHAKFTRLGLAYTAVTDKVKHLQCILKEHLISVSPQVLAAVPPPQKKKKKI
ncbi:hypothetical protein EMCRGX_G021706 [Ephydatia muelleri]